MLLQSISIPRAINCRLFTLCYLANNITITVPNTNACPESLNVICMDDAVEQYVFCHHKEQVIQVH